MKLCAVYALVGEDGFLQMQELSNIIRQLPEETHPITVEGDKAEIADVLDELRSFSMFGGSTKLIVVRNGDELINRFREPLERYVENPSGSGVLVLRLNSLNKSWRIAKLIDKLGGVISCAPPAAAALTTWIIQRGKTAHKLTVTPAAANRLADLIGDDLGKLDNELAKLALQSDGKIDLPDIGRSIAFQREQEMWDLTNALAVGQTTEALSRWRKMVALDPNTEFRAVTWLGMWLEDVRKVLSAAASGQNPQNALPKFKYRDPRTRADFVKTAQSLGPVGARRALDLLAEIDHHSKSGLGQAATNVERFILTLSLAR